MTKADPSWPPLLAGLNAALQRSNQEAGGHSASVRMHCSLLHGLLIFFSPYPTVSSPAINTSRTHILLLWPNIPFGNHTEQHQALDQLAKERDSDRATEIVDEERLFLAQEDATLGLTPRQATIVYIIQCREYYVKQLSRVLVKSSVNRCEGHIAASPRLSFVIKLLWLYSLH